MNKYRTTLNIHRIYSNYSLNEDRLDDIGFVINRALSKYSNVLMIRLDLHFPLSWGYGYYYDNPRNPKDKTMSRFMDSFKAKLKAQGLRLKRRLGRVNSTSVDYVWARENDTSDNDHYHLCLFLNYSRFRGLGLFDLNHDSLYTMITEAWASALNIEDFEAIGLAYIPDNPYCCINKHSQQDYERAFVRAAYLAKDNTKVIRSGVKSFDYSKK